MKFKLENFLELDTTQLLAVNGGSGCGGSSGGGSYSGSSSSGGGSSGGGSSSSGSSSSSSGGGSGGGSCGGGASSSVASSNGGGSSSSGSGGGSCGGSTSATYSVNSSTRTVAGSSSGSCGGINTINNTGISIPNGYDLPSMSNKEKKQPISIDSEGVTLTIGGGVDITIGVDVTGGYTAGSEGFGIDVYPVGIDVKTPIGTFSGELEAVTVKVKVDY